MERLLEKITCLVEAGCYPTPTAARMGLLRGEVPPECIVRRGRRIFLRPEKVREWIDRGMPRAPVPDLRRRRGAR